jgi:hypothetical protein
MRTHGCRWPVVVLLVVSSPFLLQACGGGQKSQETAPSVRWTAPPSVVAGNVGFTLTVIGTSFRSGAVVRWNGVSLSTTFVSATQLAAMVEGSRLTASAAVTITVVNPGSSGGTSNGVSFGVENSVPVVMSLTPSWTSPGGSGVQLSVGGSGFSANSQVQWNGTALSTTFVSGHELNAGIPAANLASEGIASVIVTNPSPGGGTSIPRYFTIGAARSEANHVTSLNMEVAGMVWDASNARIYAALPATASSGNSVVAIDPVTGATAVPVPVGNDPNLLALSADASHLWVSLDGANAIQRLTLPDLAPDIRIDLPPSWGRPQVAIAMQAAPVSPNTLAVIRGDPGAGLLNTAVTIYDDSVQRPGTTSGTYADSTWLQWGSDDRTLYSQSGVDGDFYFDVLNADASGVRMDTHYHHLFPGFYLYTHYDRSTGRVYGDDGRVFDPSTSVLTGTFNFGDLSIDTCLPDPVGSVVFCLGRDASQKISGAGFMLRAFDKNTYRGIGDLRIPFATGEPQNLIRWGNSGIAFNTTPVRPGDTAAIYLVDGPFINASAAQDFSGGQVTVPLPILTAIAPESATVGSPGVVLTISGSEFLSTATAYWKGDPLATTFHSSTELQAVVPASKLAQEGPATVSVANDSSSYAANSLVFTVLPASSGMIVRNLASLDIAWDAVSSRLYAPVWSADSRYANSVVAIDPADGDVSKVAAVAADPVILRISRDGTLGYIGFNTVNLVTQFHAPALDSLTSWSLGVGSPWGPYSALDIQPAPDSAQTTAVVYGSPEWSFTSKGLVIFDNGVARPQRLQSNVGSNKLYDSLQWGLTDSLLYAVDNEDTGFDLSTIGVDATGATFLRSVRGVLTQFHATIHFDRATGYLYADDGYATDPATGGHPGRYNGSGLLVPDSSLNRVFILGQTSSQADTNDYTIASFDQAQFTPVRSLTLRGLVGIPAAFIRWGTSGLAIVTYSSNWGPTSGPAGMLYIIDNPTFVSATKQVQAGGERLTVGLTWRPGGAAVSSSKSVERSADSEGKVVRPYPKRGMRNPQDRQ